MNKNSNKNINIESKKIMNQKTIIIIGIISLILTVGISFAIYITNINQSDLNEVIGKCIGITKTSETTALNLQNALPMVDSSGLAQSPYTITVTNTCETQTPFVLTMDMLNIAGKTSNDYIPTSVIKVDVNGITSLLSGTDEYTPISNSYESRIIYYGVFNGQETKDFDIRMWLDESATLEQASGKYINTKVSVYAGQVSSSNENIIVDLDANMIPIMYHNNEWVVADSTNSSSTYKWFDYDIKQWANAATIVPSELETYKAKNVGDPVNNDDVMGYFVYIPRYRYTLWNVNNTGNELRGEQEILIDFENKDVTSKSNGVVNRAYLTHPAFTMGTRELNGFWIGKFETSSSTNYTSTTTSSIALQNGVYVKPYLSETSVQYSIRNMTIYNQYLMTTALSGSNYHNLSTMESGVISNMKWGATTYLSHSIYGTCNGTKGSATCTDVKLNSNENYYTGTGPQEEGSTAVGAIVNIYSSPLGLTASTTHNIYGIYDMAGGAWEYVMGVMKPEGGNQAATSGTSGFSTSSLFPSREYYDLYDYGTTNDDAAAFARGHLGDATKEVIKNISVSGSWYGDSSNFLNNYSYWVGRGGRNTSAGSAGIFYFAVGSGTHYPHVGTRIFLAKR